MSVLISNVNSILVVTKIVDHNMCDRYSLTFGSVRVKLNIAYHKLYV